MNIFTKIKGHSAALEKLKKTKAHALLLSGPSGVGKKLAAQAWAQKLLCEKETAAPCGMCSSCLRVEKSQHPDFMFIAPQSENGTIKVEQIREAQNFVSLKAYEGGGKFVLIDEAQTMTAQGANSLLKTLEEPPEKTSFALVTSNRSSVLPTVQSRCQKVLFGSLKMDDLRALFPKAEDWALELAQGRADQVARFSDETFKKLRASCLKTLRDLPRSRLFEGFTSLEPLTEDRDTALFAILCWGQMIKTATALRLRAGDDVGAPDEKAALQDIATSHTPTQLLSLYGKILKLEQDIQANINKNLAFEKFWMDAHRMGAASR